jgi:membrane fusion protein (multidrug efflux system)
VNVPITSTTSSTSISTTSSDVQGAQAALAQSQKQVQVAEARVAQAKANAVKSDLDIERYKPLVEKDVISKQQFDAAVAAAAAAAGRCPEAESSLIAQQEAVRQSAEAPAVSFHCSGSRQERPQPSEGPVSPKPSRAQPTSQSQAKADQAKLNLSYTEDHGPGPVRTSSRRTCRWGQPLSRSGR